jgi:hypothetical protein
MTPSVWEQMRIARGQRPLDLATNPFTMPRWYWYRWSAECLWRQAVYREQIGCGTDLIKG